jgi:hypothetical protein
VVRASKVPLDRLKSRSDAAPVIDYTRRYER